MEKKKILFNVIMVAAIALIVAGGIWFARDLKGGNVEKESVDAFGNVLETQGIVKIQRKGIGYTLEKDTVMIDGDAVTTLTKAKAIFELKDTSIITADENTKINMAMSDNIKSYKLVSGGMFVSCKKADGIEIAYGTSKVVPDDAVFSINVQNDVPTIYVYDGSVNILTDNSKTLNVTKGESLFLASNGELSKDKFAAKALNDFNLFQISAMNNSNLSITKEDADKAISERKAQVEKEIKLQNEKKEQLIVSGEKEAVVSSSSSESSSGGEPTPPPSDGEGQSSANGGTQPTPPPANNEATPTPPPANEESTPTPPPVVDEPEIMYATLSINCGTILNNMDKLNPGKEEFVPGDGVIAGGVTVEFTQGETVFDVLKRVCDSYGIQLEYSWSPIYNSHYIEGINHLYEFDCGDGSGWVYTVNGWRPNYGVSAYELEDGDIINFDYTCDLGNDV